MPLPELFTTWNTNMTVGGLTVNLRQCWVNGNQPGHANQIFWFPDPSNPVNPLWIDLPPNFPLIDFYWPEIEVSRGDMAGALEQNGVLSGTPPQLGLSVVVAELVNWGPLGTQYQTVPSSTGACLLEMMRAGYDGLTVPGLGDYGRHWVRQRAGQVEHTTGWAPLTSIGAPSGAGGLVRQARPWSWLAPIAFPGDQRATLFGKITGQEMQVPLDALYTNPQTRSVRATLLPAHTNAIVKFLLALGGHYIDPQYNGGNPSRKAARYELLLLDDGKFLDSLPPNYPLTDGVQRLAAVRALLETAEYLDSLPPNGFPTLSYCFRSRAYDHTGQVWPAAPLLDVDCVGGGLRSVGWREDFTHPQFTLLRGFQPKFLGVGGSIATMVAMFPSNRSQVDSYFWCTPGIEVMTYGANRFVPHMNAYATNTLLETYYDDFLNHVAWSVMHEY